MCHLFPQYPHIEVSFSKLSDTSVSESDDDDDRTDQQTALPRVDQINSIQKTPTNLKSQITEFPTNSIQRTPTNSRSCQMKDANIEVAQDEVLPANVKVLPDEADAVSDNEEVFPDDGNAVSDNEGVVSDDADAVSDNEVISGIVIANT